MTDTIRILIADDQDLVRGALAALLSMEPDLEVVAQAGRGDEVLALVREFDVDVALLDIEMPGANGIDVAEALRDAGIPTRALIVTTFGRPGYLRRAMAAGAAGFVVKDTPAEQLADAVRAVFRGERVVDPALAAETLDFGVNPLTGREMDVLNAARDGSSVREIAKKLMLSGGTVRNHLSSAMGKTGAANRAEAVHIALERGWLLE
ncbi:response regulator transcription factor [Gulosibacter molinativorax]|uniref:DNA-binding response regulator n=1 Tax=Gulosibacter molinativorax TaxID=256821 RepID=A0ABT7C580_9MICO|nr:response regulator transcription factor [Gulosibacter molinativorax]MDJ1369957.1 DNA-binding response regulator [Gulosibacter molinativorax]QUY63854.1 Two-component system, NarL family, response regulator DesR [Gulosibacter molinativorax]